MAGFKQAKSDFRLRLEAKDSSPFVAPEVMITLTDKLEVVGDPVKEQLGALEIVWVKVKCTKGEGFADNEKLQDFVEPAPVPDEELEIEFRRSIELTTLAELCYRNALRHHTNSALLLALARTATGDRWTETMAKPKEGGDRIGIYGFTQSEWDAAVGRLGVEADVRPNQIATARAQCEVAGFLTGEAWQKLAAVRGDDVRAIDLYLAFLTNAEIAIKVAGVDEQVPLSNFLTAEEAQVLSSRATAVLTGATILPATPKGEVVKALATKLDAAFDFVRNFAEGLVGDNLPAPIDRIEKTETELDHEDPIEGADDPVGPGSPIVVQEVPKPAVQPGDGTLLISEVHLIALWKRSLFPIDGRGIILFGLRGCLPVDTSGTDFAASHKVKLATVDYRKMRCTIGQWRPGKGFALFPGSTVPFVDLVESAARKNGAGVNQMGRGRYRNYRPGSHKRSQGRKGHRALLQESDISFQRTAGDVNYSPDDRWDAGRPGDNIHCAFHMGPNGKFADAVYSSAGCQVVAGTVTKGKRGSESGPWKKFIAPFLGNRVQSGLEYVLFDGRELDRMIRTQMAGETVVLRMGSEGAAVKQLQQKLGMEDPDGKFGPNTFRAVIKFQHQNFGTGSDDGIVGPQTAGKLGLTLSPFSFADAISSAIGPPLPDVSEPATPGGGAGSSNPTLGSGTDPKFASLLALISSKESNGNYNAFFGKIGNQDNPRFTKMTIKEVRQWQDEFVAQGSKSSAVGKYQIIRKTLKSIIARLGLDGTELFNPTMQDRMAIDLLGQRKLADFLSRRIGIVAFGNRLAMEWASLPVLSNIRGANRNVVRGESFHAGDGLNKAHLTPETVEGALKQLIA